MSTRSMVNAAFVSILHPAVLRRAILASRPIRSLEVRLRADKARDLSVS